MITYSVFRLAARRTVLCGWILPLECAPVSEKRVGLNRSPVARVMGVEGFVREPDSSESAGDFVGICIGWRDGRNLLSPPPLFPGDHPACGLALSALHAELSRRRGTPRRARARYLLRNRPVLGAEIRTGDRATTTPAPSAAEQSLAPRRDGGADRRRANVSVACRRSRGRGPRHAGSASARHSRGVAADA